MHVNPVYLILGVLSAAYAAPLDTGIDHLVTGQVNSDAETYIQARAHTQLEHNSDKTVYVAFEGEHAVQMVDDSGPPDNVQNVIYFGLQKLFKGFRRVDWTVHFHNGFNSPEDWPILELQIQGIGKCLYVWCKVKVTPQKEQLGNMIIVRSASAKFVE
ncbi:hypothetical protein GGU11DRAFT_753107 [Lentinula aff. detonsa]|nr:hypothetical protein GGU11DRAFT_753107 [Lentinula aff. detonsa]